MWHGIVGVEIRLIVRLAIQEIRKRLIARCKGSKGDDLERGRQLGYWLLLAE